MIPLLVIEGTTGSGKSNLAIQLATLLNTQIISADSRQIYKYMDIGTAKVTAAQRQQIPHHLIDVITPDQSFNAGKFKAIAAPIIADIHASGKIPIVCGGTGLYIRSLLEGLCILPDIPSTIREQLNTQLASDGLPAMYAKLQQLDPSFAARISDKDSQRILRGLEVVIGTGIPISCHWQNQERESDYRVFRILLDPPREVLYKRINERLHTMVATGLVEEIKSLFAMGYTELSPGLNSLGYKEFIPYLKEQSKLDACTSLAAQHHRNYAKRQATWYRKCIFDLTLVNSQINMSEMVNKIQLALEGESHANSS